MTEATQQDWFTAVWWNIWGVLCSFDSNEASGLKMFSFLMYCIIHRIMESRVLSTVATVIVELTPFQHECVYK